MYLRNYINYKRFYNKNGIHYDFEFDKSSEYELSKQKAILKNNYRELNYLIKK